MERANESVAPHGAEPCVWMSAGLVAYKLCDRDFDCDRCPLDAALRGGGEREAGPVRNAPAGTGWKFPGGRSYSPGHLWMQRVERDGDPVCRVGVDAFAVALMGTCLRVRRKEPAGGLRAGSPFCELDLDVGTLPLLAPGPGRVVTWNDALGREPSLLVTDPYEGGWVAEVDGRAAADDVRWAPAHQANRGARLDLRRFRRAAAMRMLAADVGLVLADGGGRITDLRQMVGASAYCELLRDLIH